MAAKPGERHHQAKLSDSDVSMIRWLHGQGISYSAIARKFETTKDCIRDIVKYRRRYVPILGVVLNPI